MANHQRRCFSVSIKIFPFHGHDLNRFVLGILLRLFIVKRGRIRRGKVTFQDAGVLQKEGVDEERHPPSLGFICGSEDFLLGYMEGFVPEGVGLKGGSMFR